VDHPLVAGTAVVSDGLPLDRLYQRFDAIAEGRVPGNSSAAHRSVTERLAFNQRRAEALGWMGFVLERVGGSGRLELRGQPAPDRDREVVPDAIPFDGPEPTAEPDVSRDSPHTVEGSIATRLTRLAWRARMRWLDDGGR
jgi:hypothetical protein